LVLRCKSAIGKLTSLFARAQLPAANRMYVRSAIVQSVHSLNATLAGFVGGGGRESNPPATAMAARPVLKTGGATGPLPPPRLIVRVFLEQRQSADAPFVPMLPIFSVSSGVKRMRNRVCETRFAALEPTTVNLHRDGRRSMSGSIANFDDRPSKLPPGASLPQECKVISHGPAQRKEGWKQTITPRPRTLAVPSFGRLPDRESSRPLSTHCTAWARSGPTFLIDHHPVRWWMRNGIFLITRFEKCCDSAEPNGLAPLQLIGRAAC
jgi:hypothetical protein